MPGWSVVRWTGVLGLATILPQLVAFVILSFAGGVSAGSFDDASKVLAFLKNAHFVFTTALILYFIGFTLFLGFIAGLRAMAVAAAPDQEWLGTTVFGAGVAITVVYLVALGLNLAALAVAASSHADAALVRALFETSGVMNGATALVPMAFFLGAAGSLAAVTKILPRWLALAGWIGSVLVLMAAFSAYGGSDPTAFWSANGNVTVLALVPLYMWTLGASVVFVRRKVGVAGL